MASLEVKAGISAASVVGLGVGYFGLRLLVRNVVYSTLRDEYGYDKIKQTLDSTGKTFGFDLNLPTMSDFAEALVPVYSIATPFAAIEDVLANGRKSAFWPKKNKQTPKGGKKVEEALFKAMRAAYYTPEDATTQQMATVAGSTFATELAKSVLAKSLKG